MNKKFLMLIIGGILGVALGKALEIDRKKTEAYFTDNDFSS